ncbi:hypothetical protein FOVG_05533 [Fusarium oxysporum f. sp. pisi HDV247]|uniref:Uncharacterized protein n=1 Tax=Fusarium oxysporum f. sp. pisi HDV247 TaxID=1080344 RepID=W9PP09_FUSOX|nr:hypothetical protein FOVG_05533 [Fusarium oxysporum f. sp. pisi HDV247]
MYERKVHASVPIRGSPLSVRRVSGSDSAASAQMPQGSGHRRQLLIYATRAPKEAPEFKNVFI